MFDRCKSGNVLSIYASEGVSYRRNKSGKMRRLEVASQPVRFTAAGDGRKRSRERKRDRENTEQDIRNDSGMERTKEGHRGKT